MPQLDPLVNKVAKAMWNTSPYNGGVDWEHYSLRRYGGTTDTRELYITLAKAAIKEMRQNATA